MILLIISSLILSPASIQDDVTICDTLNWIPDVPIYGITHFNYRAIQNIDPEHPSATAVLSGKPMSVITESLPPSLQDGIEKVTLFEMIKVRNAAIDPDKGSVYDQVPGTGSVMFYFFNEQQYVMANVGGFAFIITYPDLIVRMRQAYDNGELEATGRKLAKKPVFQLTTQNRYKRGMESRLYCYATNEGDLLLADTIEILEQMYGAGTGIVPAFCDSPEARPLIERFSDLGPRFHFYQSDSLKRAHMAFLRNRSDDPEELAAAEESLENRSDWHIWTYIVEKDRIVNLQIEQYPTRELAEETLQEWKARPSRRQSWLKALRTEQDEEKLKELQKRYQNAEAFLILDDYESAHRSFELEGSVLKVKVDYYSDFLETYERREQAMAEREAREKELEAQKK